MPGDQPTKNYRRLLSITLSLLCLINLLALMLGPASQPVSAQGGGPLNLNQCSASQSFEATMFALTVNNTLLNFNPGSPAIINSTRNITGLAQGENLVDIDFRPANGQLYALSSASRLYTMNPSTGAATPVGSGPLSSALNGTNFGFDFNPVPDRIRVVSDADQGLRLNPNNGAVAGVDGTLAYDAGDANADQDPNIVGSAYTNSFAGSTTTTLYGIDSARDILVTQGSPGGAPVSPNTGQLFTVGPLGVGTSGPVGFDITSPTNAAFASLTPSGAGQSQLYTVNPMTGAATPIGPINIRETVTDITLGGVSRRSFDICLQDDRTGSTLQFDSCTGDYQFIKCGAGAFVITGRGVTSLQGNVLTLRADNVFALVNANPGASLRSGAAVVRSGRIFSVNDRNTADNTCACR